MNNEVILYCLVDNSGRILYTNMYKHMLESYLTIYPDSHIVELKGQIK